MPGRPTPTTRWRQSTGATRALLPVRTDPPASIARRHTPARLVWGRRGTAEPQGRSTPSGERDKTAPEPTGALRRIPSCVTCGSRHPCAATAVGSPWRNSRPTGRSRPHCTTGRTDGGRPPIVRGACGLHPRRTARRGRTTARGIAPRQGSGCTRDPNGSRLSPDAARESNGFSTPPDGFLDGLNREGRVCG